MIGAALVGVAGVVAAAGGGYWRYRQRPRPTIPLVHHPETGEVVIHFVDSHGRVLGEWYSHSATDVPVLLPFRGRLYTYAHIRHGALIYHEVTA